MLSTFPVPMPLSHDDDHDDEEDTKWVKSHWEVGIKREKFKYFIIRNLFTLNLRNIMAWHKTAQNCLLSTFLYILIL